MSKIPQQLRQNIAASIKQHRTRKFPGRGGGTRCAEAFGVSLQQWSPWERGIRTPDEGRLKEIADFFKTTVEDLRRGPNLPAPTPPQNQTNEKMGLYSLAQTRPSIFEILDYFAYDLTHGGYSREQTTAIFMFLDGLKLHCLSQMGQSAPASYSLASVTSCEQLARLITPESKKPSV